MGSRTSIFAGPPRNETLTLNSVLVDRRFVHGMENYVFLFQQPPTARDTSMQQEAVESRSLPPAPKTIVLTLTRAPQPGPTPQTYPLRVPNVRMNYRQGADLLDDTDIESLFNSEILASLAHELSQASSFPAHMRRHSPRQSEEEGGAPGWQLIGTSVESGDQDTQRHTRYDANTQSPKKRRSVDRVSSSEASPVKQRRELPQHSPLPTSSPPSQQSDPDKRETSPGAARRLTDNFREFEEQISALSVSQPKSPDTEIRRDQLTRSLALSPRRPKLERSARISDDTSHSPSAEGEQESVSVNLSPSIFRPVAQTSEKHRRSMSLPANLKICYLRSLKPGDRQLTRVVPIPPVFPWPDPKDSADTQTGSPTGLPQQAARTPDPHDSSQEQASPFADNTKKPSALRRQEAIDYDDLSETEDSDPLLCSGSLEDVNELAVAFTGHEVLEEDDDVFLPALPTLLDVLPPDDADAEPMAVSDESGVPGGPHPSSVGANVSYTEEDSEMVENVMPPEDAGLDQQ